MRVAARSYPIPHLAAHVQPQRRCGGAPALAKEFGGSTKSMLIIASGFARIGQNISVVPCVLDTFLLVVSR
jgi:hypothetical protein